MEQLGLEILETTCELGALLFYTYLASPLNGSRKMIELHKV